MLRTLFGFSAITALLTVGLPQPLHAQELVITGSSTVGHGLMLPHELEVEAQSGVRLDVTTTGSGHGINALFDGSTDMAMISAPLSAVVTTLNDQSPGSINGRELVANQIGGSRVAFIVHPSNPVKFLTTQQLYGILNGSITNWSEVGGLPMPIKILAEPPGGGVRSAVEDHLAQSGNELAVEQYLQSARLVPIAVAQVPEGFGITAMTHITESVARVTTEEAVIQPYILVTRGQPSRPMRAVIEAARLISGWNARMAARSQN